MEKSLKKYMTDHRDLRVALGLPPLVNGGQNPDGSLPRSTIPSGYSIISTRPPSAAALVGTSVCIGPYTSAALSHAPPYSPRLTLREPTSIPLHLWTLLDLKLPPFRLSKQQFLLVHRPQLSQMLKPLLPKNPALPWHVFHFPAPWKNFKICQISCESPWPPQT